MPKSKHRRHGKTRPREHETHAPERKPDPSPAWVPATGVGLLVLGVAVILLGYLPDISARTETLPLLGANWGLVLGFVILSVGFGILTRWR
jgi:hypothetical protein